MMLSRTNCRIQMPELLYLSLLSLMLRETKHHHRPPTQPPLSIYIHPVSPLFICLKHAQPCSEVVLSTPFSSLSMCPKGNFTDKCEIPIKFGAEAQNTLWFYRIMRLQSGS